MFLLGYDLGSSSIKASLLEAETGKIVASATSPKKEMPIKAEKPGWAEQDPSMWWDNIKAATHEIISGTKVDLQAIAAIGISYQMHGLVLVDKQLNILRQSIIWCDSRAVEIGNKAFNALGEQACLSSCLNSPGNFTASKLKWVQENEPSLYSKIYKAMLPGDFVAMKMTGEVRTTASGLSEGIMWDFQKQDLAKKLLDYYGISSDLLPERTPTFSVQGTMSRQAAAELGLREGIPISYRAGDQPNNAFSLNVLNPGEVAATAGTSGVVYGINDQPNYDPQSRVNTFVHVNNTKDAARYGVLLCVNGTGILNSWLRANFMPDGTGYEAMNDLASRSPIGADGVAILPFGNGAERSLGNKDIQAQIKGLNFNRHNRSHLLRAGQEGIAFALNYGMTIMKDMGMKISTVRAGDANMFLSPIFREAFANASGAVVELYNTDGAQGAARGAGVGAGVYKSFKEAFSGLASTKTIEPDSAQRTAYQDAYGQWKDALQKALNN